MSAAAARTSRATINKCTGRGLRPRRSSCLRDPREAYRVKPAPTSPLPGGKTRLFSEFWGFFLLLLFKSRRAAQDTPQALNNAVPALRSLKDVGDRESQNNEDRAPHPERIEEKPCKHPERRNGQEDAGAFHHWSGAAAALGSARGHRRRDPSAVVAAAQVGRRTAREPQPPREQPRGRCHLRSPPLYTMYSVRCKKKAGDACTPCAPLPLARPRACATDQGGNVVKTARTAQGGGEGRPARTEPAGARAGGGWRAAAAVELGESWPLGRWQQ